METVTVPSPMSVVDPEVNNLNANNHSLAIVEGIGVLIDLDILPVWNFMMLKITNMEHDYEAILTDLHKVRTQLKDMNDRQTKLLNLSR